ncbi:phosphotransferase [Microbispora sp. NPDC046933]|uniref:phosphotransferase n=1 Tax=Microbispora sp. NPDC046933 TaxID=3155618 RepID=UPI003400ED9A
MNVGGIDHEWLRTRLGWPLSGHEEIGVDSVSQSGGLMGGVYRVRCAGRSFVFKGPPDRVSAWGNLAADTGLMAREVLSYRLLGERGPTAPKIAPACHWSALAPDGRGALALEDLGGQPASAAVMADGLSRSQAVAAVRCLALAHSVLAVQEADPFTPPYPWLYSATSQGLVAAVRMGLRDLPRLLAERWPESPPGGESCVGDADVEAVSARSHSGAGIVTFCHGDAWAGNILFAPPGGPAEHPGAFLIDWQFAMWGNPMSDVALLLLSSLAPASREAWQDELVRHYHATLRRHSAVDYPLEACRDDLRRAEPFAALVALATVEAYTSGMDREQLGRFRPRVLAALDLAAIRG